MITLDAFKKARADLGLSQKAMAVKLGVDQTTVWGWERHGLPRNAMILDSIERKVAELLEAHEAAA